MTRHAGGLFTRRQKQDFSGWNTLRVGMLIMIVGALSVAGICAQQQSPKQNNNAPPVAIAVAPVNGTTPSSTPQVSTSQNEIVPIAEAATGNGIDYHGGPLMLTTHNVYFIWYGNWNGNSATTLLPQFMQNLSNSPYFSINTTYEDASNPVKNLGSSVGMSTQTFDVYSQGSALTDTSVRNIVSGAMSRGALPVDANGIYFVLTSKDVSETSPTNPPTHFCTDFCGWHTHASLFGADIKYAFVGDSTQCPNAPTGQPACATFNTTVSPNGNLGADAMVSVLAHELDETVTDPDLNAWYRNVVNGGENGDLCAWNFGPTFTTANGAQANITLAGVNYLVQQDWLNDGGGRCTMASTGNVFLYASAHDQYYGCHGMATGSTTDCNNITDSNDRLICQAVAQHSQTPCSTPVTDRNLQLSCFGIAFAPNFPSNCRDITNPQMQSFCYGVSSGGSPSTPNCSTVADPDARALCNGMALHDASQCSSISNANDRQFCLGVAGHDGSQCSTISSCPNPSAQAACLDGGGTWNWSTCSCTMPVVCDPADQQACINSGGIWNSSDCTCSNSGCGTQIICEQSRGSLNPAAQLKSRDILQSLAAQ